MNLIDKDKLLDRIQEARDIAAFTGCYAQEDGMIQAEILVKGMKTVERGESEFWTIDERCSGCGFRPARALRMRNYCPKCGAYMGGQKYDL